MFPIRDKRALSDWNSPSHFSLQTITRSSFAPFIQDSVRIRTSFCNECSWHLQENLARSFQSMRRLVDFRVQRVFRLRATPPIEEKEQFGKGETSQEEKEGKVVKHPWRLNTWVVDNNCSSACPAQSHVFQHKTVTSNRSEQFAELTVYLNSEIRIS